MKFGILVLVLIFNRFYSYEQKTTQDTARVANPCKQRSMVGGISNVKIYGDNDFGVSFVRMFGLMRRTEKKRCKALKRTSAEKALSDKA